MPFGGETAIHAGMKSFGLRSWLVFFCVVLALLGALHTFIGLHLWPLVPAGSGRLWLVGALGILGTAYVLGRALETHLPRLATPLLHVGSWWLGAMSYLFLGCLLLDAVLLLQLLAPVLPASWIVDPITSGRAYFIILALIIATTMFVGHQNVLHPRVRRVSLPRAGAFPLKIAAASDLHLCALVPASRLRRIVGLIQSLQPDLILFPGDVVDEDLTRNPRGENFRALLQSLHAPLGVYAVTGNHEWISGVGASVAWMESCGITVLRDQAMDLGPCVLAGREDAAGPRFGAGAGVPLAEILRHMPRDKPIITLDHQPVRIDEAVDAGVDLLLCGHTHHGQFWPFQWITRRLFKVSHGTRRLGTTLVDVSCGAGAWGPQVRTSSRSEIVCITVEDGVNDPTGQVHFAAK
jgi:predicted MPP superfamily phosphohydrolase